MEKLPEKFEDFKEARKNGFLKIKKLKESGKNIVGIFCTYTPTELIYAANAVPVGLCGVSDETIADAERDLPSNLCPLIKASYGYALTDKCPYFYFSDLVVGETTCDGKKKMFELLGELKPTHVMELPPGYNNEYALEYWKKELLRLKNKLESQFKIEISDLDLKNAIIEGNKERKLIKEFYELGKLNPSPLSGYDINTVVEGLSFSFDRMEKRKQLEDYIEKAKFKYKNELEGRVSNRPRILVTGCPANGVREKVLKTIEDLGGDIVCYENCSGPKEKSLMIREDIDPITAIADKYLNVSCSVMSPNNQRFEDLKKLIDEYQVDAVVEIVLQACHTFNIEAHYIKKLVNEEKNKPYLKILTDYSQSDKGQIETRLEAFLELI